MGIAAQPTTMATGQQNRMPVSSGLANAPSAVYQNIQDTGIGYGDRSIMGNAYNRGAAELYNNFQNQYGQGATPFALKSVGEGGAGFRPDSMSLFNPFQNKYSQDSSVLGPNTGSQIGYSGGKFYQNQLGRNAYSGEALNEFNSSYLPGSNPYMNPLLDPTQAVGASMRGWGSPVGIGPGGSSNPFEGYFADDYLNQYLNQMRSYNTGPNSMDPYNMPDLNQFRRDFIYGTRPDQMTSAYRYGSTGDVNPTGGQWTNPNLINWATAAKQYLPEQELRDYLGNQGVSVWF